MVNFEVVKGDRKYVFSIEMGAPLGECYDVCHEVLMEIMKLAQQSADKVKQNGQAVDPEIV